ncbi:MAG: hypothetical protein QXP42_03490 [Candidatus Micrarchaeia archaeon]
MVLKLPLRGIKLYLLTSILLALLLVLIAFENDFTNRMLLLVPSILLYISYMVLYAYEYDIFVRESMNLKITKREDKERPKTTAMYTTTNEKEKIIAIKNVGIGRNTRESASNFLKRFVTAQNI